jgi:hypothetical protein
MIKMIFEVPSGKLLGVHVIGELATELVHIGLACLSFGGDIDFFIHTVFNYPTLGDVYKYAAYSALGKLNKAREAAAKPYVGFPSCLVNATRASNDGRGNLVLIDGNPGPL